MMLAFSSCEYDYEDASSLSDSSVTIWIPNEESSLNEIEENSSESKSEVSSKIDSNKTETIASEENISTSSKQITTNTSSKTEVPTSSAKETPSASPDSKPSQNTTVTIPEYSETVGNLVWVPVNGGTKYHSKSSCSNMIEPIQVSIETAIQNGFTACKRCH